MSHPFRILCLLVISLAFHSCQGSTEKRVGLNAEPVALDLTQDHTWSALATAIESEIDNGTIPGAVLLLARDGQVVGHQAFGVKDPHSGEPMDKDGLFRICSMTKATTATAAMILWERGQLGLDDPVSLYLPEFADIGVLDSLREDSTGVHSASVRPITIRHLMTHTSGIPYGEIGEKRFAKLYAKHGVNDLFPTDGRSTRDNISRLAQTGLVHQPGETWTYGLGLDVLVAVLEVASGQPYAEFLRTELLDPLDMDHNAFVLPPEHQTDLVEVWEKDSAGDWKKHEHPKYATDYPLRSDWPMCAGGAGLTSSALDYARFLQMLVDKGGTPEGRLLEESTIDTLFADHAPGLIEDDWHQGLACAVTSKPANGGFWWGGYFNTQYFGNAATGEVAVLMKQTHGIRNDRTSSTFYEVLTR
jgi:CubicO group peptidase (beta-lactamase class C family)